MRPEPPAHPPTGLLATARSRGRSRSGQGRLLSWAFLLCQHHQRARAATGGLGQTLPDQLQTPAMARRARTSPGPWGWGWSREAVPSCGWPGPPRQLGVSSRVCRLQPGQPATCPKAGPRGDPAEVGGQRSLFQVRGRLPGEAGRAGPGPEGGIVDSWPGLRAPLAPLGSNQQGFCRPEAPTG